MKNITNLSWLSLVLLLAGGCAPQQPFISQASPEAIESHRVFLASDALAGRATGTPGYDAAAGYVAAQFARAGLEPAGTDGFMQPVPYVTSTLDTDTVSMRLHRDGETRALTFREDFITGPDPVRAHTHLRAPLAFVGHGIQAPELGHDDYANIDAHGHIVVMLAGTPGGFPTDERAYYGSSGHKAETAVLAGAVGIITLRGSSARSQRPWEEFARTAGRMPTFRWVGEDGGAAYHYPQLLGSGLVSDAVADLLFEGARMSLEEVLAAAEAGERVSGFQLGYELELERHTTHAYIESPNVVGMVRGSDPDLADEYVVYTAHLDHLGTRGDDVFNGAYDNAMGTAIMLETARMFAAQPVAPRRSVLFVAVGAEERGLLGSDYFANYPTVKGRMVANINLDMPLFLYPVADLVGYGAELTTLGDVARRAARAEGFRMSPDPMPELVIFLRSDHYPFARAGVPAIFMMTGHGSTDPGVDGSAAWDEFMGTHYHRPSDDLDLPVHWPSVHRFTQVNARIGIEVANADEPPRWLPGNIFTREFGDRARTIH